ncbi:DUF1206 domain-containing protein [Salinimicrobium sediminilitoris]|uniref:DUF1206 domain-containing protein n=1 Tax=Salinimicrobium sediminilitoris TaxID=2876715 RepID=UPI001E31BB94|nr:DUF1206 domain-containing protein [Salinimicrobium sediminilitoris]MCC8359380.1 DUF1206 domain-containing protein [Salinimicrobium sediminilitoris]
MYLKPDKGYVAKVRSAGFFTKGLVYVLIGTLTFLAAFNQGGDISSTDGAVKYLLTLPLGKFLGAVVALGLVAYSLWRFYQALFLPGTYIDDKSMKSGFKRFRFFYSGVFYGFIAYSFLKPLLRSFSNTTKGNSGENLEQKAALWELLSTDWGKLVIWIVAAVVAGQALWQFKIARDGKFMKKMDKYPDLKHEYTFIRRSGKFGYIARGVVFGIISFFLVKVILQHNASIYKGTEGALQYLLSFSYGSLLLGATALGLIGYGIFHIMVARHANLTTLQ